MKVFFDTNVYVAEALLGKAAAEMVAATHSASWRVFVSRQVLDEVAAVLSRELGFSPRLASLTRHRVARAARLVESRPSKHQVPQDPNDSPILQAALAANVDYLVTNDRHLLAINPVEGLRVLSMTDYRQLLIHEGLLGFQ